MEKAIWIGLRICSTTLLDAVQWQCNTILNEQKPIQNNPSPSIEGLGPLPMPMVESCSVILSWRSGRLVFFYIEHYTGLSEV